MYNYIIIIVVILLIVAVYYFFFKPAKKTITRGDVILGTIADTSRPSHNPDGSMTDEAFQMMLEMAKNSKGPSWSFPSQPENKNNIDFDLFDLSNEEVNRQVMIDMGQIVPSPDKIPLITKTLIKSKKTLSQLTVFDDGTLVIMYNMSGPVITNLDLVPEELDRVKSIKKVMEQTPLNCCPDVGKDYPMTFITLHNGDRTKTFYADGSCMMNESSKAYSKLNELIEEKLDSLSV